MGDIDRVILVFDGDFEDEAAFFVTEGRNAVSGQGEGRIGDGLAGDGIADAALE